MKKTQLYAKEYQFVYETKYDKIRKKIIKYQTKILLIIYVSMLILTEFQILLTTGITFIFFMILLLNRAMYESKEEERQIVGIHGNKKKKYFVHLGDAVTSIEDVAIPAIAKKKNPEAFLYPLVVEDTMMLTHMFVVGTTGAGKTTFLVNILRQILMLGGGCLAVDGKGDQTVYEAFYNTAVDAGREDDFLVINFNVPTESNTFNPLLAGDADEVSDIIGNMLETEGDNAFWAGRALAMMKGLLSVVVPLRDMELLFDAKGNKVNVLTFDLLNNLIDLTNLKELYYIIREANGEEPGDEVKIRDERILKAYDDEDIKKYRKIDISRLEAYLSSVYVSIHDRDEKISESSSKQHGNSYLMWNESLDLLAGRFKAIFNTENPTIDMEDVVTNARIVYILLPALKVDSRTLSVLGKIVLSLFKNSIAILLGDKIAGTVEERYKSMARRPRVPFWGVMDEYGAYAVDGFDNVLAQARSLKVSVAILVQEIASLKKNSEIEAQRLLGNTGLKVALKVEEQKTAEEISEFLGKEEVATIKVKSENQETDEREIEVQEKELIKVNQLKSMTAGHAYIMWAGKAQPCLINFYEPPICKKIPPFSLFNIITSPAYELADLKKGLKERLSEFKMANTKDVIELSVDEKREKANNLYKINLRKPETTGISEFTNLINKEIIRKEQERIKEKVT
jgi:hypothetical protein